MKLEISKLKPNKDNPRIIKDSKFKKLVQSIKDFPEMLELRPIVVDEDMTILGGNMRYKASIEAGLKEVYIKIAEGLTEDQKKEFIIKDNVGFGEWEWDILANEWDSTKLTEWGLDVWENIDDAEPEEGLIEDDEIPEVKESKVKRGDIWKLGEHKIMCGDSTSFDDVDKLMNDEKADMVFTDPPYLMNFTGGIHADGSKSYNSKHGEIKNDKLSEKEGEKFLDNFNLIIKKYTLGAFYISFYRLGIDKFYNSLNRVGLKCRSLIIWNKGNHTLSNSDYMSKYEPIFYGWVENHNFYGGNNGMDIWDIKRTSKNNLHPTMKPIELCSKAILDGSISNNIVLDLFLGSGSTLIAAEKLNRKCYGMELDEKYCDVIIERWEQFTGKKAEKIN